MTLHIRLDDLTGSAIQHLLQEHLRDMRAASPPESVHALDLTGLRRPEVTVWSAWSGAALTGVASASPSVRACLGRPGAALMGCGALKQLDGSHGEIKSMRTAQAWRRSGVAQALLTHIVQEARRRGYRQLSLETGTQPVFAAARRLYEGFGFVVCAPFEGYTEDPNSVFMTCRL